MNRIHVLPTKHRHVWELNINNTRLWIKKGDARGLQWAIVAVIRTGHPATLNCLKAAKEGGQS